MSQSYRGGVGERRTLGVNVPLGSRHGQYTTNRTPYHVGRMIQGPVLPVLWRNDLQRKEVLFLGGADRSDEIVNKIQKGTNYVVFSPLSFVLCPNWGYYVGPYVRDVDNPSDKSPSEKLLVTASESPDIVDALPSRLRGVLVTSAWFMAGGSADSSHDIRLSLGRKRGVHRGKLPFT